MILLDPMDGEADVASRLAGVAGVEAVERYEGRYQVTLQEAAEPQVAMQGLVAAVPTTRIELHRPTLEDVFVDIVKASGSPRYRSQV